MFSTGQLLFAIVFAICFITILVISYKKDVTLHKQYYKGSIWILLAFLIFIGLLFVIKSLLKE